VVAVVTTGRNHYGKSAVLLVVIIVLIVVVAAAVIMTPLPSIYTYTHIYRERELNCIVVLSSLCVREQ
jgi:flagellar basal body-associated protein FliL